MLKWFLNKFAAHRDAQRDLRVARVITAHYARALREIANTTASVGVPNGTTRKVARIADKAFADYHAVYAKAVAA